MVFVSLAAAAGATGCSVDLGYLDDATGDDGSVTGGNVVDHTSGDQVAEGTDATNATDAAAEATAPDVVSPVVDAAFPPALLPDAGTYSCPTIIYDALTASDPTEVGRFSRGTTPSVCTITQANPTTTADQTGLHNYVVYRFANTSSAAACYTFTLLSGTLEPVQGASMPDASDAAAQDGASVPGDASTQEDGSLQDDASGSNDASTQTDAEVLDVDGGAFAMLMFAFATFYPTNLNGPGFLGYTAQTGYLEDAGPTIPYTMGITVPANSTIDVVVVDVDVQGAGGYGTFTLSCTTQ